MITNSLDDRQWLIDRLVALERSQSFHSRMRQILGFSVSLRNGRSHFPHQHFHVVPGELFCVRCSKEVRWVISNQYLCPTIIVKLTSKSPDAFGAAQHRSDCNRPPTDNEFGLDCLELGFKKRSAVFDFRVCGGSVVRGSALQGIHNVDLRFFQTARR